MALINCPECGRSNVSNTAIACPGCGFSIKSHFDMLNIDPEQIKKDKLKEQVERDRVEKIRIEKEKAERERLELEKRDASEAKEEKEETDKMLASIIIPKKRGIGFGWLLFLVFCILMFGASFLLSPFVTYLPAEIKTDNLYMTIQSYIHNEIVMGIITVSGIDEQGIKYCCIGFGATFILSIFLSQRGKRKKNKEYTIYKELGESEYRKKKLKESGWVSEVSKRREERERQRLRELQIAKQMEEQARRMEMEKNQKKEVAKYFPVQTNIIHCPTCNSTNVERINVLNRALSFELVGFASNKIGKQFQCKNCKYLW